MPTPPPFLHAAFLSQHPVFTTKTLTGKLAESGLKETTAALIKSWEKAGLISKIEKALFASMTHPSYTDNRPDPYLLASAETSEGVLVGQTALSFHAGIAPPRILEVLIPRGKSARPREFPNLGYTRVRTSRTLPGDPHSMQVVYFGASINTWSPEAAFIDAISEIRTVEHCRDCHKALLEMPTLVTPGVLAILKNPDTDRTTVARVGAFLTLIRRPMEWGLLLGIIGSKTQTTTGNWIEGEGGFLLRPWGIHIPEPIMSWAHAQCDFSPPEVDWEVEDLRPLTSVDTWMPEWTHTLDETPSDEFLVSRLRQHFKALPPGCAFRPGQAEAIRAILQRKDTLAVLPTAAGKTLIFQFLAKELGGTVLVISPLKALMHDQVLQSRKLGFSARMLTGDTPVSERSQIHQEFVSNNLSLLFISPEGLKRFVQDYQGQLSGIRLLVVDEAHCISTWGHDFRGEFRRIWKCRVCFPDIPILALTATAPPTVQRDIAHYLRMNKPFRFVSSVVRRNLALGVERIRNSLPLRIIALKKFLQGELIGSPGIVYCREILATKDVALSLRVHGYRAVRFHGELHRLLKGGIQARFMSNRVQIVAATTAFGMGINKPDVRFVVHMGLPDSIESYVQEVGRAGRDGQSGTCRLLFSLGDAMAHTHQKGRVRPQEDDVKSAHTWRLYDFAQTKSCRWVALARYFEEDEIPPRCGICDNCQRQRKVTEKTSAST